VATGRLAARDSILALALSFTLSAMPARRILLLDATRLTAYRWQMDGVQREADFAPDDDGVAAFRAYLFERRSSLFYLLADVAEESFQVEEVPFVHGRDRASMIKRKLAQYFYGTPLATAISLGRNAEGRRDERLLFSGLSGYPQFEPWLLAMRECETQLVGIYAMPMVVADTLSRQVAGAGHALVVSVTRAGLRQTFFDRGQLRFSRLSPIATDAKEQVAQACAGETTKILQYLAGQRMIARDTALPTLILAHPADFAGIGGRCQNSDKAAFQLLDLVALCKQHGLGKPPGDSRAEALFLHALVRRTPRQQFAPPQDRHFYRLWQIRFGLRATAAGIFAVSLLVALGGALRVHQLSDQQDELAAQIELGQRHYDSALAKLPKTPLSPDDLRAVTNRSDLLARRSQGLEPALQHLSRGLDQVPKVELISLDWRLADRPDGGDATPAAAGKAATDDSYVLVDVQAQLPLAMVGDYRAQIDTVDRLAAALRTDGYEVRILAQPFETESGKVLKSDTASTARMDAPKFTFRMVEKL
jgi:hypothetical protein